jgi:O-antigen/teichoic acid export membrane protein
VQIAQLFRRGADSRIVSGLLWITGGQALVALTGLAGLRILTELAPPSVFGEANLLMSLMTLGMQIIMAPITNTQLRFHSRYDLEGRSEWFTAQVLIRSLIAGILVSAVSALTIVLWQYANNLPQKYLLLMAVTVWAPIYVIRNVLLNRASSERKQSLQATWLCIEAIMMLTFTGLLLLHTKAVEYYLIGQIVGVALSILVIASIYPAVRKLRLAGASKSERLQMSSEIMSYGLPFAPIAVMAWFSSLSDRYMLGAIAGTAAVGQYAAAFAISSRLSLLVGAIFVAVFRPALFEAENMGDSARANRLFQYWMAAVALSFMAIGVGAIFVARPLSESLLAAEYRPHAVSVILWTILGYAAYSVTQVMENRIFSFGTSKKIVFPTFLGGLANVVFCLYAIPIEGIEGAAKASAASFFVQLLSTYLILREVKLKRRI